MRPAGTRITGMATMITTTGTRATTTAMLTIMITTTTVTITTATDTDAPRPPRPHPDQRRLAAAADVAGLAGAAGRWLQLLRGAGVGGRCRPRHHRGAGRR